MIKTRLAQKEIAVRVRIFREELIRKSEESTIEEAILQGENPKKAKLTDSVVRKTFAGMRLNGFI